MTLKAGPFISNEEAKVILILDISDHSTTFGVFSGVVGKGLAAAAFSMTAPREHIVERIRELEAAGLDEIAFSVPNDDARERIEELGREIVSRY